MNSPQKSATSSRTTPGRSSTSARKTKTGRNWPKWGFYGPISPPWYPSPQSIPPSPSKRLLRRIQKRLDKNPAQFHSCSQLC
ncbi:MAG: hypothetical protein [Microviridae sp.]|nr:MAG: hypothetical protein [Microviridae sp.]